MNAVQWRFVSTDDSVELKPFVDGHDLLADHRNGTGLDPDRLLPPLSRDLLPTGEPRTVLIGACSCGVIGCGSLAVSVRRVGEHVLWEPTESVGSESLSRSYRFDLVPYLDALDAASGDRPGEGRGRRVARHVRVAFMGYDDRYDVMLAFDTARIDWISARPWGSDTVRASVTTVDGQVVHEFGARPRETDHQFAARIWKQLIELRRPR